MNSIAAKQCLWPDCVIKNILKLYCFWAKVWASRHAKRISPPFSRI